MARRGQPGPRVHHSCLFVLPALLRAAADGLHLRYLRTGNTIDASAPDRALHADATGADLRRIRRRRTAEAPLPAGVACGHPARGEEEAANADRAAGEGSRDDQRVDRLWNQARCARRKTIRESGDARRTGTRGGLSGASGRRAPNSDREPRRQWGFRGRRHGPRGEPRSADLWR